MYRQLEKKLVKHSNISSTCPHNTANFGPLAAEIGSVVWGTTATFNGFLGSVTARYSSSGREPKLCGVEHMSPPKTYICQGGHHVGNRPTF